MPAAPNATPDHIRDVNTRYHDVAAATYDSKWGIDFTEAGRRGVVEKLGKALGASPPRFGRALEIGAGTGYFSLNLMRAGVVGELCATDISPGMLEALRANAAALDLEVETVRTDAEALPFPEASFDLVTGHAVLHHVPDLDAAIGELYRVLRPGGTLAFCGEPSAHGDRIAEQPKRLGRALAPLWRRAVGARELRLPDPGGDPREEDHGLEAEVDVHAFSPGALERMLAATGFEGVVIRGEELVANLYGWWTRTVEASAEPVSVPEAWQQFAYHSYMALRAIDTHLLEPRLPPSLFYNLVLSARKPG